MRLPGILLFSFVVLLALLAQEASAAPALGLVADEAGGVFFLDPERNRILASDAAGELTVLVTFEPGLHGRGFRHLCRDASGALYTAPDSGDTVWRIAGGGEPVAYYPAVPSAGAVPVGRWGAPFAVDQVGNIVSVDPEQRSRLLVLAPTGEIRGRIELPEDLAGTDLRTGGLSIDAQGRMVVCAAETQVLRLSPESAPELLAGGVMRGFQDGPTASSRLASPHGIAFEADGGIVVADHSNRRLRRISPSGRVSTIATFDWLTYPSGVAVLPSGELRATDTTADGAVRLWAVHAAGGEPTLLHEVGAPSMALALAVPVGMSIIVLGFMLLGARHVFKKRNALS